MVRIVINILFVLVALVFSCTVPRLLIEYLCNLFRESMARYHPYSGVVWDDPEEQVVVRDDSCREVVHSYKKSFHITPEAKRAYREMRDSRNSRSIRKDKLKHVR